MTRIKEFLNIYRKTILINNGIKIIIMKNLGIHFEYNLSKCLGLLIKILNLIIQMA